MNKQKPKNQQLAFMPNLIGNSAFHLMPVL